MPPSAPSPYDARQEITILALLWLSLTTGSVASGVVLVEGPWWRAALAIVVLILIGAHAVVRSHRLWGKRAEGTP